MPNTRQISLYQRRGMPDLIVMCSEKHSRLRDGSPHSDQGQAHEQDPSPNDAALQRQNHPSPEQDTPNIQG